MITKKGFGLFSLDISLFIGCEKYFITFSCVIFYPVISIVFSLCNVYAVFCWIRQFLFVDEPDEYLLLAPVCTVYFRHDHREKYVIGRILRSHEKDFRSFSWDISLFVGFEIYYDHISVCFLFLSFSHCTMLMWRFVGCSDTFSWMIQLDTF